MTSHSEFVQSVVKQYGIVALAKSMVQDQKSYGLDEHQFTQLATEHAQRIYPNDRPDVAFSKLYQSEESVRRACNVLKAMPFVADVVPLVGENRVIAKIGLDLLSRGPHKVGLRALLDVAGLAGKTIDSYHISFMVAPRVNAAGRMSTPDIALGFVAGEQRPGG